MSEDPFTSVQWDDNNTTTPTNNDDDNNNIIEHDHDNILKDEIIDYSESNNENEINTNAYTSDSTGDGNSIVPLQSKTNSISLHNTDLNNNDLEGSDLITQTMILGAEKEENENIKTPEETVIQDNGDIVNDISTSTEIETNKDLINDETSSIHTKSKTLDISYELNIKIVNPITEHQGSNSFTIYHVEIETNNPRFNKKKFTIIRRYSDFDTLYQCLTFDHPTLLIPPLPNKQRLEYIKGGRFTDEFVFKRCSSLNIFINRIIKHPILSKSEVLMIFLENNDSWNIYKSNLHLNDISSIVHSNPSVEGVTDFLMNSFKKPHVESKYSKTFKEIDHQRLNLQDNLNKIDKIYSKVVNKQDSISKELNLFGDEFSKLTVLLNNDFSGKHRKQEELDDQTKQMVDEFKCFSENLKNSGEYYNELNKFIEFNYLNNLKDLEHYLISLGNLIKLKDNKIVDYEMLDNYLEKAITERDNLIHGGSLTSTTEGTISYLSRKFESFTGLKGSSLLPSTSTSNSTPGSSTSAPPASNGTSYSDPSSTSNLVHERIEKLNERISLLEKEKIKAKKIYEKFEKDLIEEWSQFKKIKDDEISDSLNELSEEYTKLYSKSYNDWNKFNINESNIKFENKLNDETRDKYFNHSAVMENDEEIKDLLKGMDI